MGSPDREDRRIVAAKAPDGSAAAIGGQTAASGRQAAEDGTEASTAPGGTASPAVSAMAAGETALAVSAAAAGETALGGKAAPAGNAVPAGKAARPDDIAGPALARLTTLPALLIMAWLLPGLPLLLAGDFTPAAMLLISAPLLVALVAWGLRVTPGRWPRLTPGRPRDRAWVSWFGLLGTVAVAAGFTAWQLVERSESVIVQRDPGTYLQAGYWLAQHAALPITQARPAFGGAHPGLNFSSTGFFAHAGSVVPSLMSGLPMLLAGGFWARAVSGAAAIGPILGGLAVLTFGGLVARLAGPQWAPAGAIVLGLTLPEQYASRSSLAETALQVLLFGGLSLFIDSGLVAVARPAADSPPAPGWRRLISARTWSGWLTPSRTLAGISGLALGLSVLVSLDSLAYLLVVIPFAGLLVAARRATAVPFLSGVAIGAVYGFADGYVLSRPFLDSISRTMEITGVVALWLLALTFATVQLLRVRSARAFFRRLAARQPGRWLPGAVSLLAVLVLLALLARPYLQTVRGTPGLAVYHYIAGLQRMQGLPADPTRTYAEDSLYWAIWYVGLPTVLLGGFGVALLVRQCLRALLTWKDPSWAWRSWGLPLAMICAGSVAALWQPDIVPDQPWASRRLVVVVLPGLIICAIWAAAWLTGHARERGAQAVTAAVAGLFCVAALIVPTAATTFGAGLTHTGRSGGLAPSAQGLATRRIGAGEVVAVEGLCASLRRASSVVIVDPLVAQRFTQVIRGMCGVPAAWMVGQSHAAVTAVISGISKAGRQPVLLGSRPSQLAGFGGRPAEVVNLITTQDPHELTRPPTVPAAVHYEIWMLLPPAPAAGT